MEYQLIGCTCFETRVCLGDFNVDNDTDLATGKPGIRCHWLITVIFLRIIGKKCITLEVQFEKTLYLNYKSAKEWCASHNAPASLGIKDQIAFIVRQNTHIVRFSDSMAEIETLCDKDQEKTTGDLKTLKGYVDHMLKELQSFPTISISVLPSVQSTYTKARKKFHEELPSIETIIQAYLNKQASHEKFEQELTHLITQVQAYRASIAS